MSVHIKYFNLIMCLKALKKWKEAKSKIRRQNEIIKIRVEINKTKNNRSHHWPTSQELFLWKDKIGKPE